MEEAGCRISMCFLFQIFSGRSSLKNNGIHGNSCLPRSNFQYVYIYIERERERGKKCHNAILENDFANEAVITNKPETSIPFFLTKQRTHTENEVVIVQLFKTYIIKENKSLGNCMILVGV